MAPSHTVRGNALRLLPLIGVSGALALTPYLASDDFPPSCLSRQHVDTGCPACGLTRACARLVEGDVAASLAMHPVALLLVIEALAFSAFVLFMNSESAMSTLARVIPIVAVSNVVLMVAVWAVRYGTDSLPPI